jgi:hypothetical protein
MLAPGLCQCSSPAARPLRRWREHFQPEGEIPMNKLIPMTAIALMCTTGLALAADNPSGRPGQILDKAQCKQAWKAAGPDGKMLSKAKAAPYILNFARVDTSNDSRISAKEWKAGCKKGWVSADASSAAKSGSDRMSNGSSGSDTTMMKNEKKPTVDENASQ